jgi:hypothetical protein
MEVINLWMSSLGTCDNSNLVLAEIDGMTASGLTLVTRQGLALGTLRFGIDKYGYSGTEGRENYQPKIFIFFIMLLWDTCCLANYAQISFINFSTYRL